MDLGHEDRWHKGITITTVRFEKVELNRNVSFLSSLSQGYDKITCNQITLESPKTDQRLISPQIDHEKKCKQVVRTSRSRIRLNFRTLYVAIKFCY